MATWGPQNGRRGLESGLPLGRPLSRPRQLSLNKFFDLSSPSMRKWWGKKWKIMMKIMATNVVASQLPNGGPTADRLCKNLFMNC